MSLQPVNMGKKPMDELIKLIDKHIVVKLKNGLTYAGVLHSVDGFMNLYLQSAEEFDANGKLVASYGDILIRGNNILYIITQPPLI